MSWDYALRDEHLLIKDEECFVIALKRRFAQTDA